MKHFLIKLTSWFDNDAIQHNNEASNKDDTLISTYKVDWWRVVPFILLHLSVISLIWVGTSWFAVWFCIALYAIRMFAITAFYHRYFAHKTYHTSRAVQFIFALLASSAVQRGPLWWASHHRHHHIHSDEASDPHSPVQHGFLWSHLGWFLSKANFATQYERVKELTKFPELRFLDRFDIIVPIVFAVCIFILGDLLASYIPQLHTQGWQLLVWGFVISTIALYHGTFMVNSLAHVWGKRRYATKDQSRNNLWIALITLGEGWHNNHHHYPGSASQGFYWWEIDMTYYGLKLMAATGLIWDLRKVPVNIREARKISHDN